MFFNAYRESDDPFKNSMLTKKIIEFVRNEFKEDIGKENIKGSVCTPEYSMYSIMCNKNKFFETGIKKQGKRLTVIM